MKTEYVHLMFQDKKEKKKREKRKIEKNGSKFQTRPKVKYPR